MFRYKLIIEYDGSKFHGFQRQINSVTVQGVLEEAIFNFCQEKVFVIGAGRTDAGVHALGQVVHFDLAQELDPFKVQGALNYFVRKFSLSIVLATRESQDFHSRFSAKNRSYRYTILNRRGPSPLLYGKVWHLAIPLEWNMMHDASQYLVGKHDFSSFRAVECQAFSPIKTIKSIKVSKETDFIHIDITAPSFLHHMVRNIVGSLKLVGNGKWSIENFIKVLEAKDRRLAGETAPAWGLCFVSVEY